MNWTRFIISVVFVLFLGFYWRVASAAESESQTQIDQLKTNAENSLKNRESYEGNQKIADQNVKTLEDNLKELAKQKTQIQENARKADQNVNTMEKQAVQVKGLIDKEKIQIDTEAKQIEALEQKIQKIKANIEKRQNNQRDYDAKLKNIDLEKTQWLEQKQSADDLDKNITEKQKHANTDLAEWKKKAAAYAAEVKKWKAEADKNRATLEKYERLNK